MLYEVITSSVVQNDIVQEVLDASDEKSLVAKCTVLGWRLPDGLLLALSKKHYPSAHGHLSRKCMEKLLPLMIEGQQGNPAGAMPCHPLPEYIGKWKRTEGTEPSKYLHVITSYSIHYTKLYEPCSTRSASAAWSAEGRVQSRAPRYRVATPSVKSSYPTSANP